MKKTKYFCKIGANESTTKGEIGSVIEMNILSNTERDFFVMAKYGYKVDTTLKLEIECIEKLKKFPTIVFSCDELNIKMNSNDQNL